MFNQMLPSRTSQPNINSHEVVHQKLLTFCEIYIYVPMFQVYLSNKFENPLMKDPQLELTIIIKIFSLVLHHLYLQR